VIPPQLAGEEGTKKGKEITFKTIYVKKPPPESTKAVGSCFALFLKPSLEIVRS